MPTLDQPQFRRVNIQPVNAVGGPPPAVDPMSGFPSAPTAGGTRPRPQFDPTTGDPIARSSGAIDTMQRNRPTAGQGYSSTPANPSGYRPGQTTTFGTGQMGAPSGVTTGRIGGAHPLTLAPPPPPLGTMGSGGGNGGPAPITPDPASAGLRGEVYTPGNDPRLQGAQGATDAAGQALQGFDRNSMQAGNEGRYRSIYGDGQVTGNMDALNGAPDRTALALQKLKDFREQGDLDLQNKFRKVGQSAAKFGRIGMGDVNAELGSIQGDYNRNLLAKENELASSVAEGDIGDRFRKVDMQTGLAERNADRGFQRTNAALTQAGNQTDKGVGDLFDKYNAAGSLEDRVFGQGQSNRNEFRTERGYQDQTAQQTIENRIRERELQQQEEEMRLRRAAMQAQAGGL